MDDTPATTTDTPATTTDTPATTTDTPAADAPPAATTDTPAADAPPAAAFDTLEPVPGMPGVFNIATQDVTQGHGPATPGYTEHAPPPSPALADPTMLPALLQALRNVKTLAALLRKTCIEESFELAASDDLMVNGMLLWTNAEIDKRA